MTHTIVAQVLLVAHRCRRRELARCLYVEGEEVCYALDWAAPEEAPRAVGWDVIVVDGESFPDDRARLRLLRRVGERPRAAAVLYVCSRLPTETEIAHAGLLADDFVYPGWAHLERVRRRVQLVALTPWRRAMALRRRAEQLGDRRLAVLPARTEASPALEVRDLRRRWSDRVRPTVLLEHAHPGGTTPRTIVEAFQEGRRTGVAAVRDAAERLCDRLLVELAQARAGLSDDTIEDIESAFVEDRSPVVAARFGGASAMVEVVRAELRGLACDQLDAIERRAQPAGEP